MAYQTAYQIRWAPQDGNIIVVTIYDTSATDRETTILDLGYGDGALYPDPPFLTSSVDNDNDKFNTIKAIQATLSFFSGTYNASTFSQGDDNRFYVEALVESTSDYLFKGFLVMDDHEQPLLPDPQIVTLSATDNLGTLKDIPLTDSDGINPKGKFKIIQYIAWCLQKTGLQLDINVANTFYEESYPDLPAWDNIYLDAKTFEKEIGTSEDCYTVLQKILGFDCFLRQWNGSWWVGHLDEYELSPFTSFRFDYQGNYIDRTDGRDLIQQIGKTKDIKFLREDAVVRYSRPHKFVKLTYHYEYPKELVDNIDFSRGDIYTPIDPGPGYVAYHLDDWTLKKGNPESPSTPTDLAYIKRFFEDGYEKERYLVLTNPTVASVIRCYAESNPIEMGEQDKFTCSVDFRFPNNITNGGAPFYVIMSIRLLADDGTRYNLGNTTDGKTTWFITDSTWGNFSFYPGPAIPLAFNGTVDVSQWQTVSWVAPPLPKSGKVYIQLNAMNSQSNAGSSWDDVDIYYQNLQFDYVPFTNGSYQKYNGLSRTVSQSGNYKANIDDTVYISDSPRSLFKGSFLKQAGGNFVLAGLWYAGGSLAKQGITAPVPDEYKHPFHHIQIYALWNQYYRVFRTIETTLKGLRVPFGGVIPDMVHQYTIDGTSQDTQNKGFIVAKEDKDFHKGEFKVTLMEVIDSTINKDFVSPQEIKYISDY